MMQAFADGKEIQERRDLRYGNINWHDIKNPIWDWFNFDYRVKPDPPKKKLIPYESAEEFLQAMKEHGWFIISRYGGNYFSVSSISDSVVWLQEYNHPYSELAKDWLFADGTPCGKEIEEIINPFSS